MERIIIVTLQEDNAHKGRYLKNWS